MSEQEINTQTYITVLIEQRNEALNKLASYMAVTKELEKKVMNIVGRPTTPYPDDDKQYFWDEDNKKWSLMVE